MIRFKLEKKSHFLLEMLKTSILVKCLIYFNQILKANIFYNFWTELGNFRP